MTKLTPETFDALAHDAQVHTRAREEGIIWTLPAIGRFVGRGKAFARSLAQEPGTPIRQQGRQYYVDRAELMAFLKRKPETGT